MVFKITDQRIKLIFSIISYIMILVLLHLFLGRPIIRYLKKQRSELENQSQRIKEAETLVKTLPDLEKSIEIIEDDLRKIHERTVTKDQIPRIFKELTLKTRELGIEVVSIKPREDIKPDPSKLPAGISKLFIELNLTSSYRKIGEYLKALENMTIAFTLESMALEKVTFEGEELLVNMILSAYIISGM